eukprot:scaffold891_cov82-Cylindrotheca_fusiformis.AAC.4
MEGTVRVRINPVSIYFPKFGLVNVLNGCAYWTTEKLIGQSRWVSFMDSKAMRIESCSLSFLKSQPLGKTIVNWYPPPIVQSQMTLHRDTPTMSQKKINSFWTACTRVSLEKKNCTVSDDIIWMIAMDILWHPL